MTDSVKLIVNLSSKGGKNELLLSPIILSNILNDSLAEKISIQFNNSDNDSQDSSISIQVSNNGVQTKSPIQATSELATHFAQYSLLGSDSNQSSEIKSFLSSSETLSTSTDIQTISTILDQLDDQLNLRTYLSGNGHLITAADVAVYAALKSNTKTLGLIKQGRENVKRWIDHCSKLEAFVKADKDLKDASSKVKEQVKGGADKSAKVASATTGTAPTPKGPAPAVSNNESNSNSQPSGVNSSFDLFLPSAKKGQVVTRFPPEPSGYLHVGHAKAAILNQYFAKEYEGRLIIRFDDTNPSKEKSEFEDSILYDLELLGIKGDVITHTSDYFDGLYKSAIELIKKGGAYADDTEQEEMRAFRMDGIPSRRRDLSIEETLAKFADMTSGSEEGQKWCLRAKMSVDDPNKALRDPVIYRCNTGVHHRTGSTWKVYPTYDFACPLVDSLEGITHALRTNEYRDRNPQYEWFLNALDLRKVEIWDYSRLNFVYTLLSKRKLQWFVDNGHVTGWDDPRFPTVRGIRRRGMTVPCIRQFIIAQGPSQSVNLQEWDAIWTINKRLIDPVVPRYVSIESPIKCKISGVETSSKEIPKHKKNPELGEKKVCFDTDFFMEKEDIESIKIDEEITLMDWGNAILKSKDGNEYHFEANLDGDFKKTRKFTWLSSNKENSIAIDLLDFDFLITKKKLEEEDKFEDFITPQSEFRNEAIGDVNLKELKEGERLQFERKGYYILDKINGKNGKREFIKIPDGSQKNSLSKAAPDDDVQEKKRKAKEERDKKKAEKEKKDAEKKAKKEKAKSGGEVAGAAAGAAAGAGAAVVGAATAVVESAKKGAEKVKEKVVGEEDKTVKATGEKPKESVAGNAYEGHSMYRVEPINSDTLETPVKTNMYKVNRIV